MRTKTSSILALRISFSPGVPPHHPDLPVIEVTRAQPGTKVYSAHSPVDPNKETGHRWFSLEDPRLGSKASYREKMSILPDFNTLERISWIDVTERKFSISIAASVEDLMEGDVRGCLRMVRFRSWKTGLIQ